MWPQISLLVAKFTAVRKAKKFGPNRYVVRGRKVFIRKTKITCKMAVVEVDIQCITRSQRAGMELLVS